MRHGWAYIYGIPPASSRFDELVDHFAHDAITLGNPPCGEVIRVSPVGDPIPSSRKDIRQECEASKVVCFNFYVAPSDNVFCSIAKIKAKIVREAFDLSAKNEAESFRIIRSLAQLFSKRAEKASAFGFVVDRYADLHQRFSLGRLFCWLETQATRMAPRLGMFRRFSQSRESDANRFVFLRARSKSQHLLEKKHRFLIITADRDLRLAGGQANDKNRRD